MTASPAPPATTPSTAATGPAPAPWRRLESLDAYRGLTMLLMASNGLGLAEIARKHHPDSSLWRFLAYHSSHVAWTGGGMWDMIQPSFMFMVGVAVPFSVARRLAEGQSLGRLVIHAAWRSLILVALSVFLATGTQPQPNFIFTNVLAQIGLGYCFLIPLVGRGTVVQAGTVAAIGLGIWAAFAAYPLPGPAIDLAALGISPELAKEAVLPGFFAHWNMNTNVAAAVDRWFLTLFPRPHPFVFNEGGYQTLNFIPATMTMILGLMAGEKLREDGPPGRRCLWLVTAGAACLGLGLLAGWTVCPVIKRIWTPSWALVSGGVCLWTLAALHWVIDIRGWQRWAWPLTVVGTNSIAAYMAVALLHRWVRSIARTYLGAATFAGPYGPVLLDLFAVAALWLWCWWLYRRRIFLRI